MEITTVELSCNKDLPIQLRKTHYDAEAIKQYYSGRMTKGAY